MARTKGEDWMDLCNWEGSCAVHKPMQIEWDLVFVRKCKTLEVTGITLLSFKLVLKAWISCSGGQKSSPQSILSDVCNFLQSRSAGTVLPGQSPEGMFFIMEPRLTSQALININRAVPSIAPVLLLLSRHPPKFDPAFPCSCWFIVSFHCDYFLLTLMPALCCKTICFCNWKHHSN